MVGRASVEAVLRPSALQIENVMGNLPPSSKNLLAIWTA